MPENKRNEFPHNYWKQPKIFVYRAYVNGWKDTKGILFVMVTILMERQQVVSGALIPLFIERHKYSHLHEAIQYDTIRYNSAQIYKDEARQTVSLASSGFFNV